MVIEAVLFCVSLWRDLLSIKQLLDLSYTHVKPK